MSLIKAFPGLRPVADRAADVAAPPYDVLNAAEARAQVEGRPWSFLHISRPEVDLPLGTDPYADEVYVKAAENFTRMRRKGILTQDPQACYYVYRLTMDAHVQTGLVAAASVSAYDRGRIKKHEFTRPVKEDDRVRQIEALNAQTGPVFLVYPAQSSVQETLARVTERNADVDIRAAQGVRHQLWVIAEPPFIEELGRDFEAMKALYVADGHHRSAAASRVAASRRETNPEHTGNEAYNYFLSVIFPHDQMRILAYNRVVRDLNGLESSVFLGRVAERFRIETSEVPVEPRRSAEFGMYLDRQWYLLRLDPRCIPVDDPVARLDVSLLADNLIDPILGIRDPRRDDRIDFVGGIRGLDGLQERVDSADMRIAFAVFPTRMEDLMAVADIGEVMPPKSTWFEPKLADGLVSHLLD